MDDDDSSSDVQAVEVIEDGSNVEDKPILALFNRLIGNDNKQNTVLTNTQMISILNKEFNIDTSKLHDLEVDIYLSVTKKFLKDWPQWDEFDNMMHSLIKENNKENLKAILHTKYCDLISYLNRMLEEAKPMAREAVKYAQEQKPVVDSEATDVIMEVYCSRAQLNGLFYQHPNPEQNYTVFNMNVSGPSTISLEVPSYKSILNWFNITFALGSNSFYITRSFKHELRHTLVNKNLKVKTKEIEMVNCKFQEKCTHSAKKCNKKTLLGVINELRSKETDDESVTSILLDVIEEDIKDLPAQIKVPGGYQKYLYPYAYVRYLYTEVPEATNDLTWNRYDLHLEELMRPLCRFFIGKLNLDDRNTKCNPKQNSNQVLIECRACSVSFSKATMLEDLRQHILTVHMSEPDFKCTKCHMVLSVLSLTQNRWMHECQE
ncbi:uncharacterized protein LOC126378919 isoform X1 [Pectinophora gossypiella]|uniref:uncharacterized protein LOC126378919 isoform X1 n=1 Tax=Pectinophora gossypiella TaxID=13191 RepID=UPI00214E1322|nr:uncharacterized protein LOC126378919 isoform X1 [Pectinophora gossypiella]